MNILIQFALCYVSTRNDVTNCNCCWINWLQNHFVIQEIVSHENDLRKEMNFTHDLLRKNTYNVSLLFYVTKPNGNNNAFTTSILLHSICTINFGRREQFQSCSILDTLHQTIITLHAICRAGSYYSFHFFQSTPPLYRLQPFFQTIVSFCVI